MKNVRVWFKKDNECRFISHLDLNRCMLRAIHKSRIPIWYTEGFNPHPFITFALPLSLGFRGERETMDMRLIEEMPYEEIIQRLNGCLPRGIVIYDITEPQMKPGSISSALFNIKLSCDSISNDELYNIINELFSMDEILIDKKTKKGMKTLNLKEFLTKYEISKTESLINIDIYFPAGSTENVNPNLILRAITKYYNLEAFADITRLNIYNEKQQEFK